MRIATIPVFSFLPLLACNAHQPGLQAGYKWGQGDLEGLRYVFHT